MVQPTKTRINASDYFQLSEYEQHGLNEYWIVDPAYEVIEVWNIGENGTYVRLGAFAGEDSFDSAVLGEPVSVKAIFNG